MHNHEHSNTTDQLSKRDRIREPGSAKDKPHPPLEEKQCFLSQDNLYIVAVLLSVQTRCGQHTADTAPTTDSTTADISGCQGFKLNKSSNQCMAATAWGSNDKLGCVQTAPYPGSVSDLVSPAWDF